MMRILNELRIWQSLELYPKRKRKRVNGQQRIRQKPRIRSWKNKSKRLPINKLFGIREYKLQKLELQQLVVLWKLSS